MRETKQSVAGVTQEQSGCKGDAWTAPKELRLQFRRKELAHGDTMDWGGRRWNECRAT